jgi:hypothetical protein
MRSIDPRPKCGGEKPHKGRRPAAVFWSPSRFSGEAHTGLLGGVPPFLRSLFYIIYFLNLYFYIRYMRRLSRRESPLAAPTKIFFEIIYSLKTWRLNRRGPLLAAPAGIFYIFRGEAAPHYYYLDFFRSTLYFYKLQN